MLSRIMVLGSVGMMLFMLLACAPIAPQVSDAGSAELEAMTGEPREVQMPEAVKAEARNRDQVLPVRFQKPSYLVKDVALTDEVGSSTDVVMQVGADMSTTAAGPVTLREILKRLAGLKKMNVSWASDVDPYVLVDVDIRATDDFFGAIDNLLRQVDYFHEVQGNTIVVKYKETRKFHIALPPRIKGSSSSNTATSSATNVEESTRWVQIRENLDQLLRVWGERVEYTPPPSSAVEGEEAASQATEPQAVAPERPAAPGGGYYSVNEEIGLIVVTAPRPLQERVAIYIDSLKVELYRQIAIEAKIIEVTLDQESKNGIDWSSLFADSSFDFNVDFGDAGEIYPNGSFINKISLGAKGFSLVLDALKKYGETRVLSNPKISVMNGQPAVIYVGDNVTYVDKVTVTTTDNGALESEISTAKASSGLRLEVFATIIDDDEIILSLIPMTTVLTLPIQYITSGGNQVGLPEIKERTINSIVRVKNGEMLVVGGLIDSTSGSDQTKVNGLGDIPVVGKLFKSDADSLVRKELIILLRPRII